MGIFFNIKNLARPDPSHFCFNDGKWLWLFWVPNGHYRGTRGIVKVFLPIYYLGY